MNLSTKPWHLPLTETAFRTALSRIETWGQQHCALTMAQLVFRDPDFFFWALEARHFDRFGVQDVAKELSRLACRIRIRGGLVADYVKTRAGVFSHLELVPPFHPPSGLRRSYIDLSVPRSFKEYDKKGNGLLVASMKEHVLGSSSCRMTRARCAAFFLDSECFVPTSKSLVVKAPPT